MSRLALWLWICLLGSPALAQERSILPEEIEAVGGQGAAQAHAGVAALYDQAAIRLNPAMLYRHRTYDVSGGYFWPVNGRPFYKASVIDGVTSRWTAGFEYTGFQEELKPRTEREWDSPVRKRASLAISIPTDRFAFGLAGHYAEAEDPAAPDSESLRGFSLGAGLALQLTRGVRAAASLENFNNRKLKEVSPQIFRAGLAWEDPNGFITLSADYRERQRSKYLEDVPLTETGLAALALTELDEKERGEPEKMGFLGAQFRTFDVLRLFVASGKALAGDRRDRVSGGIGIYQRNFSLAYAVSRDYPQQEDLQGSLHLSIIMKL